MIVCIAEKPSVAREIAKVLGANAKHEGYLEGNGYQVTWTYGHLCTLKEPQDYTDYWKHWSLSALPMIPPRFGIKLIENDTFFAAVRVFLFGKSRKDQNAFAAFYSMIHNDGYAVDSRSGRRRREDSRPQCG